MNDLSIKTVDYDYDEMTRELVKFIKEKKATFGIDPKVVGEDYFKTEFRVAENPAEIKQFVAPASLTSGVVSTAFKEGNVPESLIQNLQKDDYYLIHFPLIIDTQFPFDHVELKISMKKEQPGLYFINAFPEAKEETLLDGKFEGSIEAHAQGDINISVPIPIKGPVSADAGAGLKTDNTFGLSYKWNFSIKKTLIQRFGGNNTWTVKWIFKRAPNGNGLNSTLENITLLLKKPKQVDFCDINISGWGSRKYKHWPDFLVKLFDNIAFIKSPPLKVFVEEGFTVPLNKGKQVDWTEKILGS